MQCSQATIYLPDDSDDVTAGLAGIFLANEARNYRETLVRNTLLTQQTNSIRMTGYSALSDSFTAVSIPVCVDRKVAGVIYGERPANQSFTHGEIELIKSLAAILALSWMFQTIQLPMSRQGHQPNAFMRLSVG